MTTSGVNGSINKYFFELKLESLNNNKTLFNYQEKCLCWPSYDMKAANPK